MTTETFSNDALTTLNGGISALALAAVVTNASEFPPSPQFRIRIDDELILVTGVSGNNFTLTRGVEGTLAAGHLSGAQVAHILTAGGLNQLKSDVLADIPPSSTLATTAVDISLTTTGNFVIDTRPASPTGAGRWKLNSIDLRLKVALTGSGSPSSTLSVGSTSGGQQVVTNQVVTTSETVGSSIGGFSLGTLGSEMSQTTGFEAIYPASQVLYANVTESGSPSTGMVTAYLLWQGFP